VFIRKIGTVPGILEIQTRGGQPPLMTKKMDQVCLNGESEVGREREREGGRGIERDKLPTAPNEKETDQVCLY
jgi:hypothetical protein